jgi:ribonuclease Z
VKREELGSYKRGFKFVYITDTYYNENIFPLAENADYLIIECTFFDEEDLARETKHLSFTIFAEKIYPKLKELNVKNIFLTHFSRRFKDLTPFEEGIKKYKMDNVRLAQDFTSVEF